VILFSEEAKARESIVESPDNSLMLSRTLLVAALAGTSYGSTLNDPNCPCLGTNYQVDADGDGNVATLSLGDYDASYGESCKAHAEPGASACQGATPAAWCSSPWCYVDPCFCSGPTDIGESDYFSTPTASGKRLFYSYAACGSTDAYSSAKCPSLAETACTASDECTWAADACGVATAKVTTARTAANCSAVDWGSFGSQCMCLGTNKQERMDDNGFAKVMVNKEAIDPKKYDAGYGAVCQAHAEPGAADCKKATPEAWCSSKWCYVDPCKCNGPTDFGLSDYFTTTVDNNSLYYSYAACGNADAYSAAKCTAITTSTACTAEDECAWSATASTCGANGATVLDARTAMGCGALTGSTNCPCIGSNGQTAVDGKIVTDKVGFSGHKYSIDYGNQCTPHGEPGSDACNGNYPASWCKDAWCYVDPCSCNDPGVGLSDYFTSTSSGKPLYYSYSTCGSADGYNSAKCPAIATETACSAANDCAWSGGACTVSTAGLTTAQTNYGCTGPVPDPAPSPSPSSPTPSGSSPTPSGTCPDVTAPIAGSTAWTMSDMEQGAEFTKCISINDFHTKLMTDEIQTVDRDATTGCCPSCWMPGIKWYSNYWGSMIVCGFKDDGSVDMSSSTSNGVRSCTYRKCYVVKMDITCKDDSKMKINGCCPKDQWNAECSMYSKSQTFFGTKANYCLSYAKKYKLLGSMPAVQTDGKLGLSSIKAYTGCAPFNPAGGASPSPSGGSSPSPSGGSSPSPGPVTGGTVNCPSVGSVDTSTVQFGSMDQGAAFNKCIAICDFNSKTLSEDVRVTDRMEGGCCPSGFIPGAKYYAKYQGAQVVCGFKDDGSVALSTGSSNGQKTCTYNGCYVQKQNLPCSDDSRQLINGCCGKTKGSRTFQDGCLSYDYTLNNAYNQRYEYCLSYDKDYGTKGWTGTAEATDDVKDGKLHTGNLYTYTPCAGSSVGGGGGSSNEASPAVQTTVGVFSVIAVLTSAIM